MGYSPCGRKELDTTEQLTLSLPTCLYVWNFSNKTILENQSSTSSVPIERHRRNRKDLRSLSSKLGGHGGMAFTVEFG